MSDSPARRRTRTRWALLRQVQKLLEVPMLVLSFVWVGLLVADFTVGLMPALATLSTAIWIAFGVYFLVEFMVAPDKVKYVKSHWISVISLVLPAFRILRTVRVLQTLRLARAGGSINLLCLLTSTNRGMGALRRTLGRSGFGYIVVLTALVALVGASGMYLFERPASLHESGITGVHGLPTYGEALWWTAMLLTTMGSEYWPHTAEGRILCWLLSLYAFGIFGYITATLATHLLRGVDHPGKAGQAPQEQQPTPSETDLREELALLRDQVTRLQLMLKRAADSR